MQQGEYTNMGYLQLYTMTQLHMVTFKQHT